MATRKARAKRFVSSLVRNTIWRWRHHSVPQVPWTTVYSNLVKVYPHKEREIAEMLHSMGMPDKALITQLQLPT